MYLLAARLLITAALMMSMASASLRDHGQEHMLASNPAVAAVRAPKPEGTGGHIIH